MLIRIIKTELVEKPKYKAYKVTYKNLETTKVVSANVVNFGDQAVVFNTLATVKPNDTFNVTVVKSGDFFNWTAIEPAAAPPEAPEGSVVDAAAPGRRGSNSSAREWEDASERHLRQILIVRQSSFTAALSAVGYDGRNEKEVFDLAEKIEKWVFRNLNPVDRPIDAATAMKELLSMQNDIPPA